MTLIREFVVVRFFLLVSSVCLQKTIPSLNDRRRPYREAERFSSSLDLASMHDRRRLGQRGCFRKALPILALPFAKAFWHSIGKCFDSYAALALPGSRRSGKTASPGKSNYTLRRTPMMRKAGVLRFYSGA